MRLYDMISNTNLPLTSPYNSVFIFPSYRCTVRCLLNLGFLPFLCLGKPKAQELSYRLAGFCEGHKGWKGPISPTDTDGRGAGVGVNVWASRGLAEKPSTQTSACGPGQGQSPAYRDRGVKRAGHYIWKCSLSKLQTSYGNTSLPSWQHCS